MSTIRRLEVTLLAVLMTPLLWAAAPASAASPDLADHRVAPLSGEATELPLDPQPGPSRQSVYHPSQRLGFEIGRLRIPAIGVDEVVRAGVDLSVIDRGVAHWVGTAKPGAPGNVVLAGHRTTFSRPFLDLDDLEPGDFVYLDDGRGREVMYEVFETLIVEPEDIWITYEDGRSMVTMFACHPKGSARFRIVVRALLVADGNIA